MPESLEIQQCFEKYEANRMQHCASEIENFIKLVQQKNKLASEKDASIERIKQEQEQEQELRIKSK